MRAPSLFVIGDSISMHYGPQLERLVAGRFVYGRKGGAEDVEADADDPVLGANGGDSHRVLAYLRHRRERGDFAPDRLLLNCGLHDLKLPADGDLHQVPLADYRANLVAILAEVPAATRVVWVRTTPVDEAVHAAKKSFRRLEADVEAYNAVADEVMAAADVPRIDLHAFSRALGREVLAEDGVHFAESARPLQAAYIAGALDALTAR